MNFKLFILFCIVEAISAFHLSDNSILASRIVGGEIAEDGVAPFQCSLQIKNVHNCGCSIVSKDYLVTAAHCVEGRKVSDLRILVGTNDLKSGGKYYDVEKFVAHEKYDNPQYAYDIAVIKVKGLIEFNEKVQPIKLSQKEVPDGVELQLTGWGDTSGVGASYPDKLMIIRLTAVSTDKCRKIVKEIHESHLCTFTKASEGACYADSGGPLVFNNELVGVVNFGQPPCGSGSPDAYAKISYLYDWVKSHTDLS